MIVSNKMRKPVLSSNSLERRVKRALGAGLVAWIMLSAGGLAASAKEWWEVCVEPIQDLCTRDGKLVDDCSENAAAKLLTIDENNKGKRVFEIEKDWSIAAVFSGETTPLENLWFDAFVFLGLQTAMLATLGYFIVITVTLVWFLVSLWGTGDLRLVPDLKSKKKRGGFERIEKSAVLILLGVLTAFAAFYFTTLQNTYLRQTDSLLVTDSISQPVFEVAQMITEREGKGIDWSAIWRAATSVRTGGNYSTTWASLGSIALLIVFWILVVCGALVVTPAVAKRNLEALRARLDTGKFRRRFDVANTAVDDAIKEMRWWPYEYLSLNGLLSVGFVLIAAVFQPGVVLVMLGLAIGVSLLSIVTRFVSGWRSAGSG